MSKYLFSEEIYQIPEPITFVIPKPWEELSPEGRQLILNISQAIKEKPGPRVMFLPVEELKSSEILPEKMISFGHQLPEVVPHQVTDWKRSKLLKSYTPEELSMNPEYKKALWSALTQLRTSRG